MRILGMIMITSIFEDNNNKIWFTTEGNGFSYIDAGREEVTQIHSGKGYKFCNILCNVAGW